MLPSQVSVAGLPVTSSAHSRFYHYNIPSGWRLLCEAVLKLFSEIPATVVGREAPIALRFRSKRPISSNSSQKSIMDPYEI